MCQPVRTRSTARKTRESTLQGIFHFKTEFDTLSSPPVPRKRSVLVTMAMAVAASPVATSRPRSTLFPNPENLKAVAHQINKLRGMVKYGIVKQDDAASLFQSASSNSDSFFAKYTVLDRTFRLVGCISSNLCSEFYLYSFSLFFFQRTCWRSFTPR